LFSVSRNFNKADHHRIVPTLTRLLSVCRDAP
jgi:hypothetical protein